MVCTHAVMSYLKIISVVSPKQHVGFVVTLHCHCQLNDDPSTGCFEETLRVINFFAPARQHQFFLHPLPLVSHPLVEFL